jgi:hypothetical protein
MNLFGENADAAPARKQIKYPPCPRGPYEMVVNEDGSRFIADRDGNDVMLHPNGPARLIECANAVPTVWFPVAHVASLERDIGRIEELRRIAAKAAGLDEGEASAYPTLIEDREARRKPLHEIL